jgi:hypothetical protein
MRYPATQKKDKQSYQVDAPICYTTFEVSLQKCGQLVLLKGTSQELAGFAEVRAEGHSVMSSHHHSRTELSPAVNRQLLSLFPYLIG